MAYVEIGVVKLRKSNILAPKHGGDGVILASLVWLTCAVHIIQVSGRIICARQTATYQTRRSLALWSNHQLTTPRSYIINTGSHIYPSSQPCPISSNNGPPRFPYHDRPQPLPPNLSHEHLAPTETTPSPPATTQDQGDLPNEDVQQPAASPPAPRTQSGRIVHMHTLQIQGLHPLLRNADLDF